MFTQMCAQCLFAGINSFIAFLFFDKYLAIYFWRAVFTRSFWWVWVYSDEIFRMSGHRPAHTRAHDRKALVGVEPSKSLMAFFFLIVPKHGRSMLSTIVANYSPNVSWPFTFYPFLTYCRSGPAIFAVVPGSSSCPVRSTNRAGYLSCRTANWSSSRGSSHVRLRHHASVVRCRRVLGRRMVAGG